jgi:hypothetical protein
VGVTIKPGARSSFITSSGGFVQNCGNIPDFDLFLKKKGGGPSPQVVDRARVDGPWVHRGPHSGQQSEITEARPSGRSRAR